MKLKDLAIDHPYYCSGSEAEWETASDFLDEFENSDIDYNLVFRWDIEKRKNKMYKGQIFMINQRKGTLVQHNIQFITKHETERLTNYLQKHFAYLNEIWKPFSQIQGK